MRVEVGFEIIPVDQELKTSGFRECSKHRSRAIYDE